MKNIFDRFIKEEDAALDQWITVILFLLITVGAYIIVWNNWGKSTIVNATSAISENMENLLGDG